MTRQHTITTSQACRFISCFRASRPREASYSDSRLHTSASFVTVRVSKCRMRTCPRAALPETRSCPPAHWTHPPDRQGSAESYLHYASSVAHRASDSFPLSSRPVSSLPAGSSVRTHAPTTERSVGLESLQALRQGGVLAYNKSSYQPAVISSACRLPAGSHAGESYLVALSLRSRYDVHKTASYDGCVARTPPLRLDEPHRPCSKGNAEPEAWRLSRLLNNSQRAPASWFVGVLGLGLDLRGVHEKWNCQNGRHALGLHLGTLLEPREMFRLHWLGSRLDRRPGPAATHFGNRRFQDSGRWDRQNTSGHVWSKYN